jgi:hypothetical protein
MCRKVAGCEPNRCGIVQAATVSTEGWEEDEDLLLHCCKCLSDWLYIRTDLSRSLRTLLESCRMKLVTQAVVNDA